eukprot:4812102-Pyramimonas_sp.AAC.1
MGIGAPLPQERCTGVLRPRPSAEVKPIPARAGDAHEGSELLGTDTLRASVHSCLAVRSKGP